jgi:SAM-dependent methyltransferase
MALYDGALGRGYMQYRRPDPRIRVAIAGALGDARSVVNVGAGTGLYEPEDRRVVAVEPSEQMIAQRRAGAAEVVRSGAERLPFEDGSFDAAMALLTLHHWSDRRAGLLEMRRVARERVVIFTWDPAHDGFWLVRDYFPDILRTDRRICPSLDELAEILGPLEVQPVLIPHDCEDGFLGAYWRRPEQYLDAGARSAISTFAKISGVEERIAQLRRDLESGAWTQKNSALAELEALDIGYRLVIAQKR